MSAARSRPRGVRFFDESVWYDGMGNSFRMRIRVGAQRLAPGRYRLYATQGMGLAWEREAEGAQEFLAAYHAAAGATYGHWEPTIQEDIGAVERLCPELAGRITRLLDLDAADDEPVLKGRPVTLVRLPGRQAVRLHRSDRDAWRLVATTGGETEFVSGRIWSAAELGGAWYRLSPRWLLPRLHEVADRIASWDPLLAKAAHDLDRAWDEAPRVELVCGPTGRPSWRDFVSVVPEAAHQGDGLA